VIDYNFILNEFFYVVVELLHNNLSVSQSSGHILNILQQILHMFKAINFTIDQECLIVYNVVFVYESLEFTIWTLVYLVNYRNIVDILNYVQIHLILCLVVDGFEDFIIVEETQEVLDAVAIVVFGKTQFK